MIICTTGSIPTDVSYHVPMPNIYQICQEKKSHLESNQFESAKCLFWYEICNNLYQSALQRLNGAGNGSNANNFIQTRMEMAQVIRIFITNLNNVSETARNTLFLSAEKVLENVLTSIPLESRYVNFAIADINSEELAELIGTNIRVPDNDFDQLSYVLTKYKANKTDDSNADALVDEKQTDNVGSDHDATGTTPAKFDRVKLDVSFLMDGNDNSVKNKEQIVKLLISMSTEFVAALNESFLLIENQNLLDTNTSAEDSLAMKLVQILTSEKSHKEFSSTMYYQLMKKYNNIDNESDKKDDGDVDSESDGEELYEVKTAGETGAVIIDRKLYIKQVLSFFIRICDKIDGLNVSLNDELQESSIHSSGNNKNKMKSPRDTKLENLSILASMFFRYVILSKVSSKIGTITELESKYYKYIAGGVIYGDDGYEFETSFDIKGVEYFIEICSNSQYLKILTQLTEYELFMNSENINILFGQLSKTMKSLSNGDRGKNNQIEDAQSNIKFELPIVYMLRKQDDNNKLENESYAGIIQCLMTAYDKVYAQEKQSHVVDSSIQRAAELLLLQGIQEAMAPL